MATLTKAQLRDRVLSYLGVLAVGQSASADDAALVEEAIDAAHSGLRKFGLVPFDTSAVPEWAQLPLRDYVALVIQASFGFPRPPPQEVSHAERELARQVSGYKHAKRVKSEYF